MEQIEKAELVESVNPNDLLTRMTQRPDLKPVPLFDYNSLTDEIVRNANKTDILDIVWFLLRSPLKTIKLILLIIKLPFIIRGFMQKNLSDIITTIIGVIGAVWVAVEPIINTGKIVWTNFIWAVLLAVYGYFTNKK